MADKTEVVNMALTRVGEKRISDITDSSPSAEKMATVYDQILDEAEAEGPQNGWKFCQTSLLISVDATAPANEKYGYRYAIPEGYLRAVKISVGGLDVTDWIREGQFFLTNQEADEILLKYVQRITITGYFPPYFVTFFCLKLANHLAYNITAKKQHNNAIYEEMQIAKRKAIALDERDVYVQEFSSSWVDTGNNTSTLE